jgi:hypothetical protein
VRTSLLWRNFLQRDDRRRPRPVKSDRGLADAAVASFDVLDHSAFASLCMYVIGRVKFGIGIANGFASGLRDAARGDYAGANETVDGTHGIGHFTHFLRFLEVQDRSAILLRRFLRRTIRPLESNKIPIIIHICSNVAPPSLRSVWNDSDDAVHDSE